MMRRAFSILGAAAILVLATQGVASANKCKASKLKALGKFFSCVATAESKAVAGGFDPLTEPKTVLKVAKCQLGIEAAYGKLDQKGGCETTGDGSAVSGAALIWRLANWAQLCVMRDSDLLATCTAPANITVTADCARGCAAGVNQGLACTSDPECPGGACVNAFPALVNAGICAP
jgi:hypothetical protein